MFRTIRLKLSAFCFLVAVTGILLAFDGESRLADWHRNPAPLKMSLADYLRTRPSQPWLQLTQCDLLYSRAVCHKSPNGQIRDVTIPIYPSGQSAGSVSVLLAMRFADPNQLNRGQDDPWQTITGMVRGGVFYQGLDKDLQSAASWKLADDYIMIDRDAAPNATAGASLLIFGLIVVAFGGFFGVALLRGWSDRTPEPSLEEFEAAMDAGTTPQFTK
jgi:hypothetical protein